MSIHRTHVWNQTSTSAVFQKHDISVLSAKFVKPVKNLISNYKGFDNTLTETEIGICTSLKSYFFFLFRWPLDIKSTSLSLSFVRKFVPIRCKTCWPCRARKVKTAKIRICTPLKWDIYFHFFSETPDVEPIEILSCMQYFVELGKKITKADDAFLNSGCTRSWNLHL